MGADAQHADCFMAGLNEDSMRRVQIELGAGGMHEDQCRPTSGHNTLTRDRRHPHAQYYVV